MCGIDPLEAGAPPSEGAHTDGPSIQDRVVPQHSDRVILNFVAIAFLRISGRGGPLVPDSADVRVLARGVERQSSPTRPRGKAKAPSRHEAPGSGGDRSRFQANSPKHSPARLTDATMNFP